MVEIPIKRPEIFQRLGIEPPKEFYYMDLQEQEKRF